MERIQETGLANELMIDGVLLGTSQMQSYEKDLWLEIRDNLNQLLFGKLEEVKKMVIGFHKEKTEILSKPNILDQITVESDQISKFLLVLLSLLLSFFLLQPSDFIFYLVISSFKFQQHSPLDDIFSNGNFTEQFKNAFLSKSSKLTRLFTIYIHLFSGQPARATEIQTLRIASGTREKSFFLKNGLVFSIFNFYSF